MHFAISKSHNNVPKLMRFTIIGDEKQEQPAGIKEETDDDKKVLGESGPEKDNSMLFFIIAAVLIVAGTVAFFLFRHNSSPVNEKITYNGFVFEKYAGLWNTQWKRGNEIYMLRLHYSPLQVQNISIMGDNGWKAGNVTYITFDPDESTDFGYVSLSAAELTLSLTNTFGIAPESACTSNFSGECEKRPTVKCSDASGNVSVIYLKKGGQAGVNLNGNCVTISGEGPDIVRAGEKVIYQWYRIMSPE